MIKVWSAKSCKKYKERFQSKLYFIHEYKKNVHKLTLTCDSLHLLDRIFKFHV